MECDVLIYGFGYTGKKALKLCETFSLSYFLIDDKLNVKTHKFINLNSLKSCKLALICVCDKKEIQEKIKQKLLDKNIDKNIIKVANFTGIKNEIFETLYNGYKDKNLLQVIINDDYYMSNFLKILEISQKEYMTNKVKQLENIKELRYNLDNNLKNQNIFSKLYDMTMPYNDTEVLKYPFFYTFADKNLDDKNFYFREKIDFQALKNRDKDTKLILCFGASAMRCHDIEIESTISGVIKEELTKNNGGGEGARSI